MAAPGCALWPWRRLRNHDRNADHGCLGTGVATEYFAIPKFADTSLFTWLVAERLGMTFQEFEKPIDFIHKNGGAYVVWVLIAGHAAAAIYHHVRLRDDGLTRMLPRRG
jgi:cytochrome b561